MANRSEVMRRYFTPRKRNFTRGVSCVFHFYTTIFSSTSLSKSTDSAKSRGINFTVLNFA